MNRFLVVFGLFILALITYIDRVCISSAKGPITEELALSDQAMGFAFSAFALGYALAQVPSGWLADRIGPRLALSAVVSAWSLLTALTGAAWNLASLLVIRFLFGIGEAGAFPGSARVFYNWLSPGERGRANGILFSGSRIGAAVAFPLLAWMLDRFEWRMSFVWLGAAGLVWAFVWLLLFRDHPRGRRAAANFPEPAANQGPRTATRRDLGLLMAQYFASNFTFFICLSWMHPYLKEHYQLSSSTAASYAMIPLLCGAGALWVSGSSVDRLFRSSLRPISRSLPAVAGFLLAGVGLLGLCYASTAEAAVACFALAAFGADLTLSPSWVYCLDVGGKNTGSVSGLMNTAGNIGSFLSANAFPWLHGMTGSAGAYFAIAAVFNIVAIGCWLQMPLKGSSGMAPKVAEEKIEKLTLTNTE
jgi:MFS transporter, ACS family, glucarate transporter